MEHERLSIDRCRQLLGPAAADRSDDEIAICRDNTYDIANVIVDAYLAFSERSDKLDLETLNSKWATEVLTEMGWDVSEQADDWRRDQE